MCQDGQGYIARGMRWGGGWGSMLPWHVYSCTAWPAGYQLHYVLDIEPQHIWLVRNDPGRGWSASLSNQIVSWNTRRLCSLPWKGPGVHAEVNGLPFKKPFPMQITQRVAYCNQISSVLMARRLWSKCRSYECCWLRHDMCNPKNIGFFQKQIWRNRKHTFK